MPVTTIQNVALEVEITPPGAPGTPIEFACQVIDAELSLPGAAGAGTRTETACPDGAVVEAGTANNGAFTGNAFVDPSDTGFMWALATLHQSREEFTYRIRYWADLALTEQVEFTGTAVVNSFKLPFGKPGKAKMPLDLGLVTASMARPLAV